MARASRTTRSRTTTATDRATELLEGVAAGDQWAFAALYDEYSPRVLGLAVRILIDRSIAEEVTQDVFLELWQNANRFNAAKGGGTGYLLTLARHRSIDRVRAEQSSRDRDERIGHREAMPEFDNTLESIEQLERHQLVERALATLPAVQREAITLSYAGHTHTEIAAMLGVPLGTIKTRLRDGMSRLRSGVHPA
ncbi:sigma-70 family RNA polymerase sigma factor [Glaciihabitans arcticus]|uniref:Sigma-70 family RNA polymerase sigma factor n=2 Tax=Glaciihabitans arcticus TaxID=2668039 RepID=A0A4Q9GWF2_9MICO|nr:sigma-70 family RNA polymerase sigma factor [Glaciihabitans arcticus]